MHRLAARWSTTRCLAARSSELGSLVAVPRRARSFPPHTHMQTLRTDVPAVVSVASHPGPSTPSKRLKTMTVANSMRERGGSSVGATSSTTSTTPTTSAGLTTNVPQLLSVAPMMDYTDVHYRQLARMLSRNTWLYTEMIVDSTLIFNQDHDRFLSFPPEQHPISCQLGGSNPETLGKAAAIVAKYGYDEINLNCGCPSDRVAGSGCFGAAMMLEPKLVAECCKAMAEAAPGVEITVKCRIGVDDEDSYDSMHAFVRDVSENSPVTHFIIHARKCLLNGLSPHQNRTVPPLRYEWLFALKRDFPHLKFSLNGGILTLEEAVASMEYPGRADGEERVARDASQEGIHGVMIGRAAYGEPWHVLSTADTDVFGAAANPAANRKELLYAYARYADGKIGSLCVNPDGHKMPSLRTLTKPILGMFTKEPRGKKWRAAVDAALRHCETLTEVLDKTLDVIPEDVLMREPRTGFDREALDCTRTVPSLARRPPAVGGGDRAGELVS